MDKSREAAKALFLQTLGMDLATATIFVDNGANREHKRGTKGKGRSPMNEIAKLILAVSVSLLSGELAAQTFKCTNAAGKITYSGTKCSELGLKDAGEIKDRLNVNPAYRPPVRAIESPRSPAPAAKAEMPAAGAEPADPERRCFTVRTAKGNVTRCNDKPDE
jgi:hypothetical protein